jgi:hypothetical protein
MFCPGCNTRVEEGERACPNCGRALRAKVERTPRRSKPRLSRLSPSSIASEEPSEMKVRREEAELELSEPAELELDEPAKPDEVGVGVQKDQHGAPRGGGDAPLPALAPDPAQLREMLVAEPAILEAGLRVHCDEQGKAVGVGLATAVGDIHLLARDASGAFVVVMVSERDEEAELVTRVLQRIGWVRKHLGDGKQAVRGIVLVEEPPEDLCYAAAAVADSVTLMTYQLALTFEAVEL